MEQWPSGQDAGLPIEGSRAQNHWVAPKVASAFHPSQLRQLKSIQKRGHKV